MHVVTRRPGSARRLPAKDHERSRAVAEPVEEREQAMSRILVGIDDSPGARAALAWAAREAQATDAALCVIHAWQFDFAWIDAVNPDVPQWRDRARDTAERLVERVTHEVFGTQPNSDVECRAIEEARPTSYWTRPPTPTCSSSDHVDEAPLLAHYSGR